MEVKNTWVTEIRKVLTSQLEACRGISEQTSLNSPFTQTQSTKKLVTNYPGENMINLPRTAKINCEFTMTNWNNLIFLTFFA